MRYGYARTALVEVGSETTAGDAGKGHGDDNGDGEGDSDGDGDGILCARVLNLTCHSRVVFSPTEWSCQVFVAAPAISSSASHGACNSCLICLLLQIYSCSKIGDTATILLPVLVKQ